MNDEQIDIELNDTTIRLVFIPFFGFVIPNITGMIDNSQYTIVQLLFAYLYFTFIAFAIWHGNRYLLFRLNRKYLVHSDAVEKFKSYEKGKILVELSPNVSEEVIVSQENASLFKEWVRS